MKADYVADGHCDGPDGLVFSVTPVQHNYRTFLVPKLFCCQKRKFNV